MAATVLQTVLHTIMHRGCTRMNKMRCHWTCANIELAVKLAQYTTLISKMLSSHDLVSPNDILYLQEDQALVGWDRPSLV